MGGDPPPPPPAPWAGWPVGQARPNAFYAAAGPARRAAGHAAAGWGAVRVYLHWVAAPDRPEHEKLYRLQSLSLSKGVATDATNVVRRGEKNRRGCNSFEVGFGFGSIFAFEIAVQSHNPQQKIDLSANGRAISSSHSRVILAICIVVKMNRVRICGALGVLFFFCSIHSVASLPVREDSVEDMQASKIDGPECLAASVCITYDTKERGRWKLASHELIAEVRKNGTKTTILATTRANATATRLSLKVAPHHLIPSVFRTVPRVKDCHGGRRL